MTAVTAPSLRRAPLAMISARRRASRRAFAISSASTSSRVLESKEVAKLPRFGMSSRGATTAAHFDRSRMLMWTLERSSYTGASGVASFFCSLRTSRVSMSSSDTPCACSSARTSAMRASTVVRAACGSAPAIRISKSMAPMSGTRYTEASALTCTKG